jgi:aminoglycoside phosphotransferase (APT) family kinase protein
VHNDFRVDNVVLDPEGSTRPVGDPIMDMANGVGYWMQADDGRHRQAIRRQPTTCPG